MYQRMEEISWHLVWLGLTHESSYVPMLRRLAGREDIAALRVLADVVEPTKDYTRTEVFPQPPVRSTPLNRLADAVRPESNDARKFSELVNTYLQNDQHKSAAEEQIRFYLTAWQQNNADLHSLLDQSFLLSEDKPLSEDLSALAAAGLRALDALDKNQSLPDAWRTEQLAVVARSNSPRANLLLMVAPPIQKLIDAATTRH
jgi:hexosaminidase